MCGSGILAQLTPSRVHRRVTAATLWPAAERTTSATGGKRKAAADLTDDEFEAEFQLFENYDDDEEAESPAAVSEPGASKPKAPSRAVESTLIRIKELIARVPHDERLASVVSQLMNGGAIRGEARAVGALQCASLISECSQQMEQIAALKRDLENRERQLVARREQLVLLVSLALD
ncbi:hypothetical protein EJB05_07803, partial [Eragrostis curvula]